MGLTHSSTGRGAVDGALIIQKRSPGDRVVALAGNPNVGKSTLFNALTGMNQHTGNWPGKTVTNAQGRCEQGGQGYILVDLPGTYSLMAHSAEEEVARNFICFGSPDAVAVVCDATALERNLNLVLQTMELTGRVVVCVNLMDEARRKGIRIDLKLLSERLGVPVVGTVARKKRSLNAFLSALEDAARREAPQPLSIRYPQRIEQALAQLTPLLAPRCAQRLNPRWLALKLLEGDEALLEEAGRFLDWELTADAELMAQAGEQRRELERWGFGGDRLRDFMVSALVSQAEGLCREVVRYERSGYDQTDRRLDRVLTSRRTGYPIMVALLAAVFWLTIVGANYPSQLLSQGLFWVQDRLSELFVRLGAPEWLHGALVLGVYRVLAWVVSVMLPPMAIFFPLFTLLEDAGYLPRIAYNLDRPFQRCSACGKQALTMAMGFGCNAAGVVGCRIIDSPRERLLAILTNNFVPCNGRLPPPGKGQKTVCLSADRFSSLFRPYRVFFCPDFSRSLPMSPSSRARASSRLGASFSRRLFSWRAQSWASSSARAAGSSGSSQHSSISRALVLLTGLTSATDYSGLGGAMSQGGGQPPGPAAGVGQDAGGVGALRVQAVGGNAAVGLEAEKVLQGLQVTAALLLGGAGIVPAPGGEKDHPGALTGSVQALGVTAEGDAVHRHVLDVDLQDGREAQVPEGGGKDHHVGLGELVGIAEAGMIQRAPLQQPLPLVEKGPRLGQHTLSHGIHHGDMVLPLIHRPQESLAQLFGTGFLPPDTAVYKQQLFHTRSPFSIRTMASKATAISFFSPWAVRSAPPA